MNREKSVSKMTSACETTGYDMYLIKSLVLQLSSVLPKITKHIFIVTHKCLLKYLCKKT